MQSFWSILWTPYLLGSTNLPCIINFEAWLLYDDVRVLVARDRAYAPPEGYTTCDKFICWLDFIEAFNSYIRDVLHHFRNASTQLHTNGYAILNYVYMVLLEYLYRPPTLEDIHYFFIVKWQMESAIAFWSHIGLAEC